MLVLRKLVVKHFQVFLYRTVLLLEHLLDAFDFKLVLSQRFQDLFRLYTGPLYTEGVLDGVFLEKVKYFHPFDVKFFVDEEIQLIPVLHQVLEFSTLVYEIGQCVNKFDVKFNLFNDSHVLLHS